MILTMGFRDWIGLDWMLRFLEVGMLAWRLDAKRFYLPYPHLIWYTTHINHSVDLLLSRQMAEVSLNCGIFGKFFILIPTRKFSKLGAQKILIVHAIFGFSLTGCTISAWCPITCQTHKWFITSIRATSMQTMIMHTCWGHSNASIVITKSWCHEIAFAVDTIVMEFHQTHNQWWNFQYWNR